MCVSCIMPNCGPAILASASCPCSTLCCPLARPHAAKLALAGLRFLHLGWGAAVVVLPPLLACSGGFAALPLHRPALGGHACLGSLRC